MDLYISLILFSIKKFKYMYVNKKETDVNIKNIIKN